MANIKVTLWGTREEAIETIAIAYAGYSIVDESPILSKDRKEVIGWRFTLAK